MASWKAAIPGGRRDVSDRLFFALACANLSTMSLTFIPAWPGHHIMTRWRPGKARSKYISMVYAHCLSKRDVSDWE